MARKTSPRVAQSAGCLSLFQMYERAVTAKPSRWPQVEEAFLAAMWGFDQGFAIGLADQGDNQNGKGDFFTDLIALVLENCSGKELYGRGAVLGLIFPKHNLDASYPKRGTVEILIETKAAGAPKSLRNPKQKNPRRATWCPGYARASRGHSSSSPSGWWTRRTSTARSSSRMPPAQLMDGVGLVAYEINHSGDGYQACKVPPHLELDRALSRVCTALRILP
ncbi:MAG TPA: hypothetical protein VH988_32595 [Thermoanaerobaculia bacterium]|jgi:hypothetical protein|nr:hypothetical protein [Thermoanaerobaculia bacterium]